MKKIVVEKTEGIAEVIDRVLNEPDADITLVIPKGSALSRSVKNFGLLKREAESAGRTVVIESVDDTVLAFAKDMGLEASHPLWRGVRGAGGLSDIVRRQPDAEDGDAHGEHEAADESDEEKEEEKPRETYRPAKRRGKKEEPVHIPVRDESEAGEEEEIASEESDEEREERYERDDRDDDEDEETAGRRKARRNTIIIWAAVILVVLGAGVYITSAYFDRADITINFKKTPWNYQANFVADKNATAVDPNANLVPAQVFTVQKNVTEQFPATSIAQVSQKAQGTITIYNNYSSATQDLVATTRFVTPDGKIFRITKNVTVPGKPGSIDAPIVADQAGPDYNIGATPHLNIPGFEKDAARYAGFYGEIKNPTTGGFIGKRATPTAADINTAKASTTAILQTSLQGGFSGSYPNNFKILDGASSIQVSKLTVNTSTDDNGNFSVFGEATLQAIGFDEAALTSYLLSVAQTTEQDSIFHDLTLDYSNVKANFAKGQVSFSLAGQGSLEPDFSSSTWTDSIQGKSISDARAAILALPNLADGKISVWPFWLWTIPNDPHKVHIATD